jgi:hypothetical protein
METLPEALGALGAFDQFILWIAKDRDGKIAKLPVDYRTGQVASAHDPNIWMSADDAIARAASTEAMGVGFVFTEADPFFFLDIDHCREGDKWSDTAMQLVGALPGAAVEVSMSGEGLHIFGCGAAPGHGCKNIPLGLELYTSGRFVALTGYHAAGNAGSNLMDELADVATTYFPPNGGDGPVDGWSSEPHPDWRGPEDDAELIKRALRSKSGGSVFGASVSFKDLWEADADKLSVRWPGGHKPYDASSADAALAQHLAFWTGSNCDRMMLLMWQSGLAREKWQREDYLPRTITQAAGKQTKFYVERDTTPAPVMRPTPAAATVAAVKGITTVSGYQYLGADSQVEHFRGCVYVQSIHRVFTPGGAMLKPDQFNATFGGYVFQLDDDGGKTTRKAWEAFTESQLVRYPIAESTCFRPELLTGSIVLEEGSPLVNTYVPIETARQVGDASPFLKHLAAVLPDERDRQILTCYLAACVQHKGVKFQWAPLLQGAEGNGKTLFTRCVAQAIGTRYTHLPNAADIDNKFNAWISNKLFIGIEDIYVPDHKREILEALKPLITNDRIEIQAKGADQVTGDNRANFILNTNLKDAIRKTKNDRRFAVFFTAQQDPDDLVRDGMGGDYFPNLYVWLRGGGYAIVTEYLATYLIPDELNPATGCHRAPKTSTTDAAINESLGSVEQEILEAVDEGKTGFAGGWISSMALDRLLTLLHVGRAIHRNKRKALLQTLGYEYHPALTDGRTTSVVMADGGKPRLFIKDGHPSNALTSPAEVTAAYVAAQQGQDAVAVNNLIGGMS